MTINDIARLAGVSIATVSRVINNRCVSSKIKERVLEVIARYEYTPNSFAQYLGKKNHARNIKKL